jgi:hypothetical protein
MRSKLFLVGIVALMAILVSAWAADISGKWIAPAQGVEITLVFKVDGTAVTGTVNNPQAGEAPMKEGKINGDEISFYVLRTIGENEVKITWKGKVAGDEIKFTREVAGGMQGGPGGGAGEQIIAKRAK